MVTLSDNPALNRMAGEFLRKHRHGVDTSEAYDDLRELLAMAVRDAAPPDVLELRAKCAELSECLRESNAMVGQEREACARTCERRDFHELCDAERARWAIHGASSVAADIRARR